MICMAWSSHTTLGKHKLNGQKLLVFRQIKSNVANVKGAVFIGAIRFLDFGRSDSKNNERQKRPTNSDNCKTQKVTTQIKVTKIY